MIRVYEVRRREAVTVNKPNSQAVGLYRHMGVEVYWRIDCGEEGPLSTAVYAAGKPPELKTVSMTPAAIGHRGHGDCRKNPPFFSDKRLQSAVRIICVP